MQQNIVTLHLLEWLLSNRLETTNVGEDVKKRTLVCCCGNVNWYCDYGNQYEEPSKIKKLNCHMTQECHF